MIRINRTIRTLHVGRVFFKISDPNPNQRSEISLLCCEKNLFLLFFCQHFVSTLSMHSCTMGKELLPFVTKVSSFWLSASWHPVSSTCSGPASTCCSLHTQVLPKDPSIPCPSLLDGGQFAHLLLHPLQLLTGSLSHRKGGLCPSLCQGVAPGTGDWEDVSGALIQTGPANLSLQCPTLVWYFLRLPLKGGMMNMTPCS